MLEKGGRNGKGWADRADKRPWWLGSLVSVASYLLGSECGSALSEFFIIKIVGFSVLIIKKNFSLNEQ
jgi:hypothetical protein